MTTYMKLDNVVSVRTDAPQTPKPQDLFLCPKLAFWAPSPRKLPKNLDIMDHIKQKALQVVADLNRPVLTSG